MKESFQPAGHPLEISLDRSRTSGDKELGVVQLAIDCGVMAVDGELERGRVDSDARLFVGWATRNVRKL